MRNPTFPMILRLRWQKRGEGSRRSEKLQFLFP